MFATFEAERRAIAELCRGLREDSAASAPTSGAAAGSERPHHPPEAVEAGAVEKIRWGPVAARGYEALHAGTESH